MWFTGKIKQVDLLLSLKGYERDKWAIPSSYRELAQRQAQQGHWGNSKKLLFALRSSVVGMNRQATDADGRRVRERRERSGAPAISAEIDARSLAHYCIIAFCFSLGH